MDPRFDLAALIETHDREAFAPVLSGRSSAAQRTAPWGRLLHPPLKPSDLRIAIAHASSELLASHLISPDGAAALAHGDEDAFLSSREADLRRAVRETADRYAGWSRSDHDRPSIRHLLAKVDEEAAQ